MAAGGVDRRFDIGGSGSRARADRSETMLWTEASSGNADAHLNNGSKRGRYYHNPQLVFGRPQLSNAAAARGLEQPGLSTRRAAVVEDVPTALAWSATPKPPSGQWRHDAPRLYSERAAASRLSSASWTTVAAFAASDGDAPLCPAIKRQAATALAALAMLAAAATLRRLGRRKTTLVTHQRARGAAPPSKRTRSSSGGPGRTDRGPVDVLSGRSTACRASSASSSSSSSEVLSSFVSTRTESLRRDPARLRKRRASNGSEARNTTRGPPRCTSTTRRVRAADAPHELGMHEFTRRVFVDPLHLTRDRSTRTFTEHSRTGARVPFRHPPSHPTATVGCASRNRPGPQCRKLWRASTPGTTTASFVATRCASDSRRLLYSARNRPVTTQYPSAYEHHIDHALNPRYRPHRRDSMANVSVEWIGNAYNFHRRKTPLPSRRRSPQGSPRPQTASA